MDYCKAVDKMLELDFLFVLYRVGVFNVDGLKEKRLSMLHELNRRAREMYTL